MVVSGDKREGLEGLLRGVYVGCLAVFVKVKRRLYGDANVG